MYLTPPVAPVYTPPGSIVSPDTTVGTPGNAGPDGVGELEPDAELVDAADEGWGVVLGHGEGGTRGLLLRRKVGGWDAVAAVRARGHGAAVVREVLEAWRGLGVLGGFGGGPAGVPWVLAWCGGVEGVAAVM